MRRFSFLLALLAPAIFTGAAGAAEPQGKQLRVGMIGLDTSHVPQFAKAINTAAADSELAGMKVVAGFPGGSDFRLSSTRVAGFTEDLRKMGIEIVDSIPALLEKVDVVMLESVDGRPHLEQVLPVLKAKKRVFIDKPVSGSLGDTIAIFEAAKKYDTPCFSTSGMRFGAVPQKARQGELGEITGCDTWGPCAYEPPLPDLFWYGIHGIEAMYTCMGTGCETVSRTSTKDTDLVVGKWKDGRVATYRGIRGNSRAQFGGMAFTARGVTPFERDGSGSGGDSGLLVSVARFFQTGKPPVEADETIELVAFMEAAQEAKRYGGQAVKIDSVMAKGKVQAAARLAELDK